MKTQQDIKNQYAQELGYDDWEELIHSVINHSGINGRYAAIIAVEKHLNEICIRAQKALTQPIHVRIDEYQMLAEKYKDDMFNNRKYTYKAEGLKDAIRIINNPENLIR